MGHASAASTFMIIIDRYLSHPSGNADRKAPRRVIISKNHISNCITAFFSGRPGFYDSCSFIIYILYAENTPAN